MWAGLRSVVVSYPCQTHLLLLSGAVKVTDPGIRILRNIEFLYKVSLFIIRDPAISFGCLFFFFQKSISSSYLTAAECQFVVFN